MQELRTVPSQDERLVVFARHPRPGAVKTRLIGAIGAERAARLQEATTRWTLAWALRLQQTRGVGLEVHVEGAPAGEFAPLFGSNYTVREQSAGDLGARMRDAFAQSRRDGARRTVLVGTDAPGLDARTVESAFDALARCEAVLGPAWDGGYYLIGLRSPADALFQDVPWGTDAVFARTAEIAERAGMSLCVLDPLPDVDRPEDLPHWTQTACTPVFPLEEDAISIVIPTRNEAAAVRSTIEPLLGRPDVEVVVVDGGSRDETPQIVRECGARLLTCLDGRGAQLNLGAAVAKGATLLFLHADTKLPADFPQLVRAALAQPDVAAGAFRFRLDRRPLALRIVEWGANLRSRLFESPYGDQAIFAKAASFWSVGGFPQTPILEDYELVRRLKKVGRIALAPGCAVTSARRWEALGALRTLWINQKVLLGRRLGVPPSRLADWYRRPLPPGAR